MNEIFSNFDTPFHQNNKNQLIQENILFNSTRSPENKNKYCLICNKGSGSHMIITCKNKIEHLFHQKCYEKFLVERKHNKITRNDLICHFCQK